MTRYRWGLASGSVVLVLGIALAGCGSDVASPTASVLSSPSPGSVTVATDLSVIGCATEDSGGVGNLTGAWQGNDSGIYYIRQVGDCVWWFGTELTDIERGVTGQRGFANVASGRLVGTQLDLEWVDIPLGDILNGGGLTYYYNEGSQTLTLAEQRGGFEAFGGTLLRRIQPEASPSATAKRVAQPIEDAGRPDWGRPNIGADYACQSTASSGMSWTVARTSSNQARS